jgi:hypothetical protein
VQLDRVGPERPGLLDEALHAGLRAPLGDVLLPGDRHSVAMLDPGPSEDALGHPAPRVALSEELLPHLVLTRFGGHRRPDPGQDRYHGLGSAPRAEAPR